MDFIPRHVFYLIVYHFIFYRKFYENPYRMCTSELASTYFPFWRYLKGRILFKDHLYYPYPASIPFLSSFYPSNILTSFASKFIPLDWSFKLFAYHILIHSLIASLTMYFALLQWYEPRIALFGAISIAYMAYAIKPFTPSAMFTMSWIPGMMIKGSFGLFSFCMAFLGGYWPILVYIVPFIFVNNTRFAPLSFFGGLHHDAQEIFQPDAFKRNYMELCMFVLLALQLMSFLWYWPRSVRHKQPLDRKTGRVPLWRYLDFVLPNRTQTTINGVFWPEMAMFIGVIPLFCKPTILWGIAMLVALTIQIQRIPARALYLLSFSLVMMVMREIPWWVIPLQGFLLLENAKIYPHFPFCQWWDKPSRLYSKFKDDEWPNWTGYLKGKFVKTYVGGFSLKC